MPVIGAVITLAADENACQQALRVLNADTTLDIGELNGRRLPVVIETSSTREDRARFKALHAIPGVLAAEPVFVDFSDLTEPHEEVCT
jgi:nitrate reductase NapAB chaperone NapD